MKDHSVNSVSKTLNTIMEVMKLGREWFSCLSVAMIYILHHVIYISA